MQSRKNALQEWLQSVLHTQIDVIIQLTGDASFRQYYRVLTKNATYIVMDAPPHQESISNFLDIAAIFRNAGILTPQVYAYNKPAGFIVLEDFGDTLLLSQIAQKDIDILYRQSIDILMHLHKASLIEAPYAWPHFNQAFMLSEMDLFNTWFLDAYLQCTLTSAERSCITTAMAWIAEQLMQQPQVIIHRDYHSRNIMVINSSASTYSAYTLGVIDFQDAMLGPIMYDIVSLLRDCYVLLSNEQLERYLQLFYSNCMLLQHNTYHTILRWFDLCGLQRHLKVLGVFSRLHLRDNKSDYLNDLPLTLQYVMGCVSKYAELAEFASILKMRIMLP